MNKIIQHETYLKFPSGVEYWTYLLSRPPLAFKVMVSPRSLKSDSVLDAFCASSWKDIKKYQQKVISVAFCVVSISSEPLLLQVVPNVFTAARKRLLGIDVIKFEVVPHLGVIVDYFSHLLVPSALRVPLSLSSRRRSLHDVQGTRCLLTFVITRSLAGAPFRNIFTEEGGSLRYLLVYGYGRDQSVLFSLFTASGKRVSISVAWVHLYVGVASTWG